MGLPIYNYLDLSTAHIKKQTDRFLDRESQWPLTDIIAYKKWGGYFVFVPEHDDLGNSLESDQIPMDLKRCIKFARKHGCNWILFDSDAEIVNELPTYRW